MPRGEQAETRRSRDGTWAKKGSKSQFGYKLHVLMDRDYQLIHRIEATTASLHDSRIDLSGKAERCIATRGISGWSPRRPWTRPCTGRPAVIRCRSRRPGRNKAISRTRSLVERPFAWMKRVLKAGHLMVTMVARVRVKNTFPCIDFNLHQLLTLKAQPAER